MKYIEYLGKYVLLNLINGDKTFGYLEDIIDKDEETNSRYIVIDGFEYNIKNVEYIELMEPKEEDYPKIFTLEGVVNRRIQQFIKYVKNDITNFSDDKCNEKKIGKIRPIFHYRDTLDDIINTNKPILFHFNNPDRIKLKDKHSDICIDRAKYDFIQLENITIQALEIDENNWLWGDDKKQNKLIDKLLEENIYLQKFETINNIEKGEKYGN